MRFRSFLHLFPLFLVFIISGHARAESTILDEIVVHGQEVKPNEENLTIREVRESSARDIGEALKLVPGISTVNKGAIANDIVLRGFQRDNINVFLDGVRLYGGCPSRMDPPSFHFDFAEVDYIEITKGPYDVRNPGSLGGVINAVSKSPDLGPGMTADLTYGSHDMVNAAATASYGTEKFDALAGYAYKYSLSPKSGDGKRLTDIYPATSPNRYNPDDIDSRAYNINTFWTKGGVNLTDHLRTELGYSYQDADHVLYPYLFMDAEYDRTHRINWTTTMEDLSDSWKKAKLQVYWNQVDHLMHDSYRASSTPSMAVTRDYSMETDATSRVYGMQLSGDFAVGPGTLGTGIDFYNRNWDATNEAASYLAYTPQPMIPDVDVNNYGVFAEYTWPVAERWTLKGGIRLDSTTVEADRLSDDRLATLYQPYFAGSSLENDADFTEASGNLQLSWKPQDHLEFFAGLGSGTRTPDPQELYIGLQRIPTMMMPGATNWIGNPDLEPTRNNQADIGVKVSGERHYASAALFYSDLSDYIYVVDVPDPDGPGLGTLPAARTYQNVDANIWGGEMSGQLALPLDLYLRGVLSYTEGENDDSGEPLVEIPPWQGSASLRYDREMFFAELTERFADRQDRVDDTLNEEETAGWGVTDIKAGVKGDKWSIFAGVNNVFDKYYFSHLSYQRDPFRSGARVPETGAFAYVTGTFRF